MRHPHRRAVLGCVLGAIGVLLLNPGLVLAGTEPRVSALLDRMMKATLEGDIEGYLACVDRRDPVFFKEQENWAADFKRHVPKEFILEYDETKVVLEEGSVSVPLTVSWQMGTPDARRRELKYNASFVERDGVWLYAGEKWDSLEGPGVKVCFAAGLAEVARTVIEIMPEIREHVDAGFENKIARVQEVKLYSSMKHLQQSIYLSYTDALAGWNEPGESIKILAHRRTGANDLKPLLAHEYGHVATFELGPKANQMPWWILEGVAELSAERYGHGQGVSATVRSWARRGRLVAWDRLSDFHTVVDSEQGHVYTQGHHMIGFISDHFGRAGRNAWLTAMAQGKTIDEATRQVMGMDFQGLDRLWRSSLPETESAPVEAGAD